MAKKSTDIDVRERLRKWLAHISVKFEHQYPTAKALAKALGMSGPGVTQILTGKRSAGLDVLVKMHRKFHIEADLLLDTDPPEIASRDQSRPFYGSSVAASKK